MKFILGWGVWLRLHTFLLELAKDYNFAYTLRASEASGLLEFELHSEHSDQKALDIIERYAWAHLT